MPLDSSNTAPCIGCLKPVPYRTNSRVCCLDCAAKRKRDSGRKAAEKMRRKRGVPEVKGTTAACARCQNVFVRQGTNAKFCERCREDAGRERAKERINRLSRDRGAPQMGEAVCCKNCAKIFSRTAPIEFYCATCKEMQRANQLPQDKERIRVYSAEWRQRRKLEPGYADRERERLSLSRSRRKQRPGFAINERMSAAVRQCLESGKRGLRWEKIVGYTLDDLMVHLEKQFMEGMNWDNRGEWHIDHIVPLSSFQYDDHADPEFQRAWALPNLRPLWAADNIRKSGRRTHLL